MKLQNPNAAINYELVQQAAPGEKIFDLPYGRRFAISMVGNDGGDVYMYSDGSLNQTEDHWIEYPDMPLTTPQMLEFTSMGRTKITWDGDADPDEFCVKLIPVTYNH